jgi:hypothetical protein
VTEDLVEEIWRSVAANAKQILTLTAQADRLFTAPPNTKPVEMGVSFEVRPLPEPVEILVGDVTKVPNPRSGRDMLAMAPLAVPVMMKDYGVFSATRSLPMPRGWVIPRAANGARLAAAIDRLRWHGVRVNEIADEVQVAVERFSITDYTKAPKPFQGRQEARLTGTFDKAQLTVPAGSLFVPANQPLARLAFYLLEPESDDGLVTWNIIEEGLAAGQTYPIYRVTDARRLTTR